jgi:cellulose synthase/poly-beta-1,6-N-acetylglucosamine synthase-like glycosyltransferase
MLRHFSLYDLFMVSFVQLLITTLLLVTPARRLGTTFRWTGSRVTEVFLGALGAVAVAALACFVTAELWGLSLAGLELAAYLLAVFSIIVIVLRNDVGVIGQVFHASYLAAGFTFIAFAGFVAASATLSIAEAVTASLLLLLDLLAFLVWGSNMSYVSDVLCRTRHSRPAPMADPSYLPMVSLHIPAYNEPPDLLINTIKAVERIDYPNFEVVIVDNNTSDPAVWGPVEEYCRGRERVRFVHVAPWPGYKAGACNLALRRYTDPRAEIIGLIDADDIVQPHYLRETIPYFVNPGVGFIQTFEGNRDFEGSAYYQACVDSYQGFYLAIMSSRNERDSVPFVGTMGLFRRSALVGIGGWNEWCISEDTEASLRMSKAGWSGLYIPRCFGRGVVPPTFAGLNTQRHRWCFGAMQIFRLHWRSLIPWDTSPDNHLSRAQRRDYLMACMSWTRDLLMLGFALLLLVVTGLRLAGSHFALTPFAGDRSLLPMSLILIATICMIWTLRHWTTMSHRRAFLSLMVSLSASWVTALACVEGMARRDGVFLRTSKTGGRHHRLRTAVRASRSEFLLAAALYVSAGLLAAERHPPLLLIGIIALQGTVYFCTPLAAMWNLRAQRVPALTYRHRFAKRRLRLENRRRPSLRVLSPVAAAVLALGVGVTAGVFVAPGTLLNANSVVHRVAVRSFPSVTDVFVKLGSVSSRRAPYYSVSSVRLASYSPGPLTGEFELSFHTSSMALLNELVDSARLGHPVPALTLVVQRPSASHRPATTEWTASFSKAGVTSFQEELSGSPSGSVTLSLVALSEVLASRQAVRDLGPLPTVSPSSPKAPSAVSIKLGSTSTRPAPWYSVSSVELSQLPFTSSQEFRLRFQTSSRALLEEVMTDLGVRKHVQGLTLRLQEPATTEWNGTFSKVAVSSVDENLAGALSGTVTLTLS